MDKRAYHKSHQRGTEVAGSAQELTVVQAGLGIMQARMQGQQRPTELVDRALEITNLALASDAPTHDLVAQYPWGINHEVPRALGVAAAAATEYELVSGLPSPLMPLAAELAKEHGDLLDLAYR